MAGHSKWANIKHRKSRQDAKRGKIFSKLVKKISSAARRGGGDPEMNAELRLYIQKAKDANMPADNIERAILKATGQLEGVTYTDFTYEGYGPGGVAYFLEGSTDNKNRTVGNVRHAFTKHDGNLGENGCVSWMFKSKGIITFSEDAVDDFDSLMMVALEHGAEDLEVEGGVATVTTESEDFHRVRDAFAQAGYDSFLSDEITMIADNDVEPTLSEVRQNMRLIDVLEDDDDIENVYHNMELSDDVAEVIGSEE